VSDGGLRLEDPLLQPHDKVFIFNRNHFRAKPMVFIEGSVRSAGQYGFKKGMRVSDLVLAGGGLSRDADRNWAELYRTDPDSGDLSLVTLDLEMALANEKDHNLVLQDLDRLIVHSIWETSPREQVSVVGAVNQPGDYSLAQGMRIHDLILAAGNVSPRAFLKVAELTRYQIVDGEKRVVKHEQINLEKVLRGDKDANIVLQPYDVLNIRTLSNWRTTEKVTLSGEVRYPGTYPIEEGERLSSVLQRAGGYTSKAYLWGAVFQRESIREQQEKQIQSSIRRMEESLSLESSSTTQLKDEQLRKRKQQELNRARQVLEEMKKLKANGRMVIRLDHLEALKGGSYDLALRDGDRLHIPIKPDEVIVMGQVYNQTAIIYDRLFSRDDYIDRAGGGTRYADKKNIYVVRANGEVEPERGWRAQQIRPGDVIVVPEKLERFSLLDNTLDWSRVLMQLGVGVASMKTLDVL